MTSWELARALLAGPDLPVTIFVDGGDCGESGYDPMSLSDVTVDACGEVRIG